MLHARQLKIVIFKNAKEPSKSSKVLFCRLTSKFLDDKLNLLHFIGL